MIDNISNICKTLNHGVYVVGVTSKQHANAFTASWLMQVSFNPLLLAISINPHNYSFKLLQESGICSVNVLGQHQYPIAAHFGRTNSADKMAGFTWQTAKTGAPILADSLAYFDCRVSHYTAAGDHQLAVCEVIAAGLLQAGTPMLYSQTGTLDNSDKLYQSKT